MTHNKVMLIFDFNSECCKTNKKTKTFYAFYHYSKYDAKTSIYVPINNALKYTSSNGNKDLHHQTAPTSDTPNSDLFKLRRNRDVPYRQMSYTIL